MPARFSSILLVVLSLGAAAAAGAQDGDLVWVWNQQCVKPVPVALQVRLDGKNIYSTSLALCQWGRQFEKGKASFRFTAARALVWYGYRSDDGQGSKDPGETTPAGTRFEVEFWQAGGEKDAIELGYMVAAADGIHMNALHLVSPTEERVSTMAPGLILVTRHEKKR